MKSILINKIIKIATVSLSFTFMLGNTCAYAYDNLQTETSDEIVESSEASSSKPVINSITGKKNSDGTVTFTVDASGGEDIGNKLLFYKFYSVDDNGKKIDINQNEGIGQNYSLDNTYKCKATAKGNHNVYVEVENSNNEVVSDSKNFEEGGSSSGDDSSDKKNLEIDNLTVTGDYITGQNISIKASVTADDSNIKYKFVAIDSDNNEDVISNSSKNSVTWTPSKAGDYQLKLYVTDSYGNKVQKTKSITINDEKKDTEDFSVSLKKSLSSLYVGKTVKFTASSSGGNGDILYKFVIDGDGEYESTKYKSSNVYSWTPGAEGSYVVTVTAKDEDNKTIKKEIHVSVKPSEDAGSDPSDADSFDSSKVGLLFSAFAASFVYGISRMKRKNQ